MPLPTKSIKGLEIFATGRHNGDVYSEGDLDDMVNAFGEVGFEPVVKAGHQNAQENSRVAGAVFGEPALGYVSRIWRKGQKLLADISGIPARFADLISAGSYKRVSSEIYWNYETQDAIYPRVLKAIAFLGADIPALTSLRAVESLFQRAPSAFAYGSGREVRVYSFQNVKGGHMPLKTYADERDLLEDYRRYTSHDCDRAASERIQAEINAGTSAKELAHLAAQYERGAFTPLAEARRSATKASQAEIFQAGLALDRDTRSIMQQKSLNYSDAFREAQELAPATASIYNHGIKLAQYTDSTTEPSPVVLIANLAGSIREFPGGPIDFARAADAVNQFVAEDIRISAASECLDRLARHWSKDRAEIEVEHLDLAEAASDGQFTEQSLRDLLWPQDSAGSFVS